MKPSAPAAGLHGPTHSAFDCEWHTDLRTTGSAPERLWAVEVGVPLLALISLLGAGLIALIAPTEQGRAAPLALIALLVACLPWAHWLARGDDGPTITFLLVSQVPIVLLGLGYWGYDPLNLGHVASYPLLMLPGMLLVIISLAAIPARDAAWVCGGVYLAFAIPVLVAVVSQWNAHLTAVVTWHVGFALSLVAGYAARLGYQSSLMVAAARESLALQAAADERRHIARDVHDVVAHTLAVTMLHMTAARMAVQRNDSAAAVSALEEAERQGRASLTDVRRIVRLLRADEASSNDESQPGLGDVGDLVEQYRTAGLRVTLEMASPCPHASPSAELAMFRVVQEALTNAARYGQGSATVALRAIDHDVELEVSNPVAITGSRATRGSGLVGMQERIAAAGGSLVAGVREGNWVVRALVPGEAVS